MSFRRLDRRHPIAKRIEENRRRLREFGVFVRIAQPELGDARPDYAL